MTTILIVGTGGREHALAWRCRHEGCRVLASPGSDAIGAVATCVGNKTPEQLVALCGEESVDLVIIGPEQPLVDGLADTLRDAGIDTLGPGAAAARLEGSKADAKAFMERHGIPTAAARTVHTLDEGLAALDAFEVPPVVKADGLAAGKGVVVAQTREEAEAALRACMVDARFGEAGSTVVLEERLVGEEASFFVLTDGSSAVTFVPAQDHKRIGEGDTGPNTGGMGAYVPAPVVTPQVQARIVEAVVEPTLAGLREEGRPFVGVLFVGLMIEPDGTPKVIEYNCRFGDPEVQPLMFGLDEPLVPHLLAAARGGLESRALAGRPATTVVMASATYPAGSRKGDPITGIEALDGMDDVIVFHAGTRKTPEGGWETGGGRVLGVCARGATLREAIDRAYGAAARIDFPGRQMRRDIGAKALDKGA